MNLLLGIGNDLLGDDGIGCRVADQWCHPDWTSYIAGTVPENFTRTIREINPHTLVLVDAARMNLSPGTIRIIPQDRVADTGIGTHQLPLDALCDIVSRYCEKIIIIGIQPENIGIGEEMSHSVKEAGKDLLSLLADGTYGNLPVFGETSHLGVGMMADKE
jgi:hydrogenase 3 maturation protease